VQNLVEDFLQYLRHERGQSNNTAKTYAALLGKFTKWAARQNLADWKQVELKHLMAFLHHERTRDHLPLGRAPSRAAPGAPKQSDGSRGRPPRQGSAKRLSSESVYLEIAALRAF
jgi:ferric-dicitrate binding protein FerR (iron transport regulator)